MQQIVKGSGVCNLDVFPCAAYDIIIAATTRQKTRRSKVMDRKIFEMNLSVEATSAYILICNLAESGTPITIESAGTFWNDKPEALVRALEELNLHGIIFEAQDANQMRQYHLNPSNRWRKTAAS
jgi:hypothetical protein